MHATAVNGQYGSVGTLWSGATGLVTAAVVLILVTSALVDLVRVPAARLSALVQTVGAAALVIVAWRAVGLAEASTDWVDTDADGMLDGFANGGYDWTDVNGEAWGHYMLLLGLPVLVAVALTVVALRYRRRSATR